jgi:hypothetical protein
MTMSDTDPIEIPGLDVVKAKRYSRTRLAVLGVSTLWSVARLSWFASDRRALRLKESIERAVPDKRLTAPAFFALATVLSWLSSLPISYFGGHAVERGLRAHEAIQRQLVRRPVKRAHVGCPLANAAPDSDVCSHAPPAA